MDKACHPEVLKGCGLRVDNIDDPKCRLREPQTATNDFISTHALRLRLKI